MPRKIEISHKTIIFTLLVLGGIIFLYQIRDIIMMLFVALLITVILNPLVTKLSRFKIPRSLSVLIVYLLFFTIIIGAFAGIVPSVIEQTTNFASSLPEFIKHFNIPKAISDQITSQVLSKVADLPASILGIGINVVTNIFTILTVLTFAFYLLMLRNKVDGQLGILTNESKAKKISDFIDELEKRLGGWARGQLALMIIIGVLSFIGLTALKIPFALPLSIFAGLMEIVPYLGPIIGGAPSVIVGFGISPVLGLATIALVAITHQLENYVLAPKIIEKSVGVSPIVTLVSLAVGFKLAGITGVLLSVPIVITLEIFLKRYFASK